jgi:hypothetical protein
MMYGIERIGVTALLLLFSLVAPSRVTAQVEVEVDPFAYALNGYSLHLATVLTDFRVSLGAFGIDVPRAMHGNAGWNETMRGAGIKVDYLGSGIDGFFAGADGGYMRNRYALATGGDAEVRGILGLGVRGGYRLPIGGSGLYVAPWVGVSRYFNGDPVTIGNDSFDRSSVAIFPTMHIGWRF